MQRLGQPQARIIPFRVILGTVLYGTIMSGPAWAADTNVPTVKLMQQVEKTCPADFARLCPDQTASDGQNMMICLKAYRPDLTLDCRRAVVAATHSTSK